MEYINPSDVTRSDDITILDVRNVDEIKQSGMVEGAINIPLSLLPLKINEVDVNKPVYVYCAAGGRASNAAIILEEQGYTVYNTGGFIDWYHCGHNIVDI